VNCQSMHGSVAVCRCPAVSLLVCNKKNTGLLVGKLAKECDSWH
jgi:hypothetical protein